MKRSAAAFNFDPALEKKLLGWIVVSIAVVTLLVAGIRSNVRDGEGLEAQMARAELVMYLGGGVNLLLLGLAFCVVRMSRIMRRGEVETLEAKVRARTAELSAANEKLQMDAIEQKWGQAALERIVQHHELVLNSIQTGIFVISRSGRIIQANAAAGDLSRKEAKQLAGKSISTLLLNGEEQPRDWESHFLSDFVREGKSAPLKPAHLKQADGSVVPVQIACHPTHDREKLTGAVVTVRAQLPTQ